MKIRNSLGMFVSDPVVHGFNCKNCGKFKETKCYHNSLRYKFCGFECYREYRIKNKDKYDYSHSRIAIKKAHERLKILNKEKAYCERHARATKKAMYRVDVQEKLTKKKGPMSFERRKQQSDALVGKRPKNFWRYVRSSAVQSIHNWITLGGQKYYMRSTWERNIARYFEFLKSKGIIKNWEYEPERFIFHEVPFGNRSYLPDFRLTENNGDQYFVEVKGFMDRASKTKLNRMKKYYPQYRVELLMRDRYMEISKNAKIIPDWEWEQSSRRTQFWMKKGLI